MWERAHNTPVGVWNELYAYKTEKERAEYVLALNMTVQALHDKRSPRCTCVN